MGVRDLQVTSRSGDPIHVRLVFATRPPTAFETHKRAEAASIGLKVERAQRLE